MFRHFRPHFHAPAWAAAHMDEPQHRQHGRQHHGKHFMEELFGFGGGDEPRTRRGDIKFLLLSLLAEQPSHGYDLIKQMAARYGGFRRLSPGSVYPTLQLLEDGGYVTSETRDGKRVYTITEEGRQFLAERTQQESSGAPWSAFKAGKPEEFHQLRQAATELAGAIMQVARSGNADRMNRVRELLDRAKREIYAMLSEE